MKVIILPFISGLLLIADSAPEINCHSQIQAHNHVNQIANHAPIDAYKEIESFPNN